MAIVDWSFWIEVAFFLIPLYLANSSAVLLAGKTSMDFGKFLPDKQRILGSGKTWKGFLGGIIVGTAGGWIAYFLFPSFAAEFSPLYFWLVPLIAFGALLGDAAGSFLKRRLFIPSGAPTPVLDQLDFVIGAYAVTLAWHVPSAEELLVVLAFTLVTHIFSNYFAFWLKLKKVPW
ncbi:MAG: CDP-2,3-bis-(O-geranylgeranyl)-sn-glycerol synthase [Candidatus Diapherotrites archaeon]